MPAISVANSAGLFSTDPSPTEAAALKVVVVLLIAGVAGVMAFTAWRGECASGFVFATVDECIAHGYFKPDACRNIIVLGAEAVRHSSTVFTREQDCRDKFDSCIPHETASGFTPVPVGYCVSRTRSSMMAPEPVYRRINAAQVGGRP
jgi:uncharacterized protein YgiB involved in biofilm formation